MSPNKSPKEVVEEIFASELEIDEFLSELAERMIQPIAAKYHSDMEGFKEAMINLLELNLKRKFVRETIENFTEKEVTFVSTKVDKLIEFSNQVDYLKLTETIDGVKNLGQLDQEVKQMRIEYNSSIGSMQTSVKSIENSASVLSSAVSRIDREIGDLAKGSDVNNSVSAAVSNAQLALTNMLASKQELRMLSNKIDGDNGQGGLKKDLKDEISETKNDLKDEITGTKTDLEGKIQDAKNNAWIQFSVLIATLLIGFGAMIATIFASVIPSIRESKNAGLPIEKNVQVQPANQVKKTHE